MEDWDEHVTYLKTLLRAEDEPGFQPMRNSSSSSASSWRGFRVPTQTGYLIHLFCFVSGRVYTRHARTDARTRLQQEETRKIKTQPPEWRSSGQSPLTHWHGEPSKPLFLILKKFNFHFFFLFLFCFGYWHGDCIGLNSSRHLCTVS